MEYPELEGQFTVESIFEEYKEYANTQIRKLTSNEIQKYMSER